jgi:signal-transduction protein with cAMP-binding, CBS, and nucleotidyltransferase domain
MGNLKPGATYIYERNGEEIYARESGKTDRTLIGYQYENKVDPRTNDGRPLYEHIKEDKLWGNIRRAAKTNSALQEALEHAILIYHLSKDHGKK